MKILWRIAIKEDAKEHENLTKFSHKFGDDLETVEQIHHRMAEIQEEGIRLEGIHFHCGSAQNGSSNFEKAVRLARLCLEIGRQYGHPMTTLDVGGGFPSDDLTEEIVQALSITKDDPLNYRVIAEPGRHFSAQYFYLLTRVIGSNIKAGRTNYFVNESIYHSFMENILSNQNFDNAEQFYSRMDIGSSELRPMGATKDASVFGMTCCGLDVIARNPNVPEALATNDWLCFSGLGAYTHSLRTNFNGMRSTEIIESLAVEGSRSTGSLTSSANL